MGSMLKWGGGGGWGVREIWGVWVWVFPQKLIISFLRRDLSSPVAVSKQLHYEAHTQTQATQQYDDTLFQCLNRDKRASDVARSVDTPHRGDLTEMKRRPRRFVMKLLILWGKKGKRATIQRGGWLHIGIHSVLYSISMTWATEKATFNLQVYTPQAIS